MASYTRSPQTVPDDSPGGSTVRQGVADQNSAAVDDLFVNLNSHSNNEDGRTHAQIDTSLDYIETNFFPLIESAVDTAEEAAENAENAEASASVYAQNAADCAASSAEGVAEHAAQTGTAVHGLGTVSTSDVVEGSYDSTEGRVLINGSWGLGKIRNQILTGDYDDLDETGFYVMDAGASNRPADFICLVIVQSYYEERTVQKATTILGETYTRTISSNGGPWSAWSLMYNQSNTVGTVAQSAGVPTGSIIESDSTPDGQYTKFSDGTLICKHSFSGVGGTTNAVTGMTGLYVSDTQQWTFPHAFAGDPPGISCSISRAAEDGVEEWGGARLVSTTGVGIRVYSNSNSAQVGSTISPIAIGRWF